MLNVTLNSLQECLLEATGSSCTQTEVQNRTRTPNTFRGLHFQLCCPHNCFLFAVSPHDSPLCFPFPGHVAEHATCHSCQGPAAIGGQVLKFRSTAVLILAGGMLRFREGKTRSRMESLATGSTRYRDRAGGRPSSPEPTWLPRY